MDLGEQKASVSRTYDELAAGYDQSGPPFYARAGVELVRRLAPRRGERVLDAGCGQGACLFAAAEAVGPAGAAIGIDVSAGMVRETAAEAARRGLANVVVKVGDAEAPGFDDASLDVVTSGFVLRQLPDPARAVREYARVLRPGGRLGVSNFVAGFDARWRPVEEVFERFGVASRASDAVDPVALARDAGFGEVGVAEAAIEISLAGVEEWWDYLQWSVYRGMVTRIPAERLDEAREGACGAAERLRDGAGRLVMPVWVRNLTAVR